MRFVEKTEKDVLVGMTVFVGDFQVAKADIKGRCWQVQVLWPTCGFYREFDMIVGSQEEIDRAKIVRQMMVDDLKNAKQKGYQPPLRPEPVYVLTEDKVEYLRTIIEEAVAALREQFAAEVRVEPTTVWNPGLPNHGNVCATNRAVKRAALHIGFLQAPTVHNPKHRAACQIPGYGGRDFDTEVEAIAHIRECADALNAVFV